MITDTLIPEDAKRTNNVIEKYSREKRQAEADLIKKKKAEFNIALDIQRRVDMEVGIVNKVNNARIKLDKQKEEEENRKKQLILQNGNMDDPSSGTMSIEERVMQDTFSTGTSADIGMKVRNIFSRPETHDWIDKTLGKEWGSFVNNAAETALWLPTDNRDTRTQQEYGLLYDDKTKKYSVPKKEEKEEKPKNYTDIMFSALQQKVVDGLNREQSTTEKVLGIGGGIVGLGSSFLLGAGPARTLVGAATSKLGVTTLGKLFQFAANRTPWLKWLGTAAEGIGLTATNFTISDTPFNAIKAVDDMERTPFFEGFLTREWGSLKMGATMGSTGQLTRLLPHYTSKYINALDIRNPVIKQNLAETADVIANTIGSGVTGAILSIGKPLNEMLIEAGGFMIPHGKDVLKGVFKNVRRNIVQGDLGRDLASLSRVQDIYDPATTELDKSLKDVVETIISNGGTPSISLMPTNVLIAYKQVKTKDLNKAKSDRNWEEVSKLNDTIKEIDGYIENRILEHERGLTEGEADIVADKMAKRDLIETETKKNIISDIPDVSFFGELVQEESNALQSVIMPIDGFANKIKSSGTKADSKELTILRHLESIIEGSKAKEVPVDVLNNPFGEVRLKDGSTGIMFDVIAKLISERSGIDIKTVGTTLGIGFTNLQNIEKYKQFIASTKESIENSHNNLLKDIKDLNLTKAGEEILFEQISTQRRLEEASEMIWKSSDERKLFEGMSYKAVKNVVHDTEYASETAIEFVDMIKKKIATDGPDKSYTDFIERNLKIIQDKFGDNVDLKQMEVRLANIWNTWSQKTPTSLIKISIFKGKTPYPSINISQIGAGQSSRAFSLDGPYTDIAKTLGYEYAIIDNMDITSMERLEEDYPWKPGLYNYNEQTGEFYKAPKDTEERLYEKREQLGNLGDIIKSGSSLPRFFTDLLKNDIIALGSGNTKQLFAFKTDLSRYYQSSKVGEKVFYNTNVINNSLAGGIAANNSIARQLKIVKEFEDTFGKGELEKEYIDLNSDAPLFLSMVGIKTYKDFIDTFVVNDSKTVAKFTSKLTEGINKWNQTFPKEQIDYERAERLIRSAGEVILGGLVYTIHNAKVLAASFGYKEGDIASYIKAMSKKEYSTIYKRGPLFNKNNYASPNPHFIATTFETLKPSTYVERNGEIFMRVVIGETAHLSERLETADDATKKEWNGVSEEINWKKGKTGYDGGSLFTYGQLAIFNQMMGIEGFGGSSKFQIALQGFAAKNAGFEFDKNDLLNKKLSENNVAMMIDRENTKVIDFDSDIMKGKKVWNVGEKLTNEHIVEVPVKKAFRVLLSKNETHIDTAGPLPVIGSIDITDKGILDIINQRDKISEINKYDVVGSILKVIREDASVRIKDYDYLVKMTRDNPGKVVDLLLKTIDKNNIEELETVRMFNLYPGAIKYSPELQVRFNALLSKYLDQIVSGQTRGSSAIYMPYSYEKTVTAIWRMAVRDNLKVQDMKLNEENTHILEEDIERQVEELRSGKTKNKKISEQVNKIIAESFNGRVLKEGYSVVGKDIATHHKLHFKNNRLFLTVLPSETFQNYGASRVIGVDRSNNAIMVSPKVKMGTEGKDVDGDTLYGLTVDSQSKSELWDILWQTKDEVNEYYSQYRKFDINEIGVEAFQNNMETIGLKKDPSLAFYNNKISSFNTLMYTIPAFVSGRIGEVTNTSKKVNTIVLAGLKKTFDVKIGGNIVGTVTYGENEKGLKNFNTYIGSLKTALLDPKNGHIGVTFSQKDLIIKALETINVKGSFTKDQLDKALAQPRKAFVKFYNNITKPINTLTYGKAEGETLNITNQNDLIRLAKISLRDNPTLDRTPLYQTIRDIKEEELIPSFNVKRVDALRDKSHKQLVLKYGDIAPKYKTFLEAGLSGKMSDITDPVLYKYSIDKYFPTSFKSDYMQFVSTLEPIQLKDKSFELKETKNTQVFSSIMLSKETKENFTNYISNSKQVVTSLTGKDGKSHKYSIVIVPNDSKLLLRLGVSLEDRERIKNSNIVAVATDETGKTLVRVDSEIFKINNEGNSPISTFYGEETPLTVNNKQTTKGKYRLSLLENIMFPNITPEQKLGDIEKLVVEGIGGIKPDSKEVDQILTSSLDPRMYVPQYRLDQMERDIQKINKYGTNIDLGPKIVSKLKQELLDEFYTNVQNNAKEPNKVTESIDMVKDDISDPGIINIWYGKNENSDLSNFAIRPFTIDGKQYKSVEQYFQAIKAFYVDDNITDEKENYNKKIVQQILNTTNPYELKALGKKIQELDKIWWDDNAAQEMEDAILESFKNNPTAIKELLETGDAKFTHEGTTKDRWTTEFPEILSRVRERIKQSYKVGSEDIIENDIQYQKESSMVFDPIIAKKIIDRMKKEYPNIQIQFDNESSHFSNIMTFDQQKDIDTHSTYMLSSVNNLMSPRATEIFAKGEKNKWSLETILTQLQIPKDQKQVLLNYGITNREDLIIEMLADHSQVIEIETVREESPYVFISDFFRRELARLRLEVDEHTFFEYEGKKIEYWKTIVPVYGEEFDEGYVDNVRIDGGEVITDAKKLFKKIGYDVPKGPPSKGWIQVGGFDVYRYNRDYELIGDHEIYDDEGPSRGTAGIPAIDYRIHNIVLPGIEIINGGHLQNKNSIGHIRSDEVIYGDKEIGLTKIRRIWEIQSDLFQHGRGKILATEEYSLKGIDRNPETGDIAYTEIPSIQNNFVNFIGNSGWPTFFVKNIMQDAAKKGYDRVWIPTGPTIARIEGHILLEKQLALKEGNIKSFKEGLVLALKPVTKGEIEGYKKFLLSSKESLKKATKELEIIKKEAESGDTKFAVNDLDGRRIYHFDKAKNEFSYTFFSRYSIDDSYNNGNKHIITEKEFWSRRSKGDSTLIMNNYYLPNIGIYNTRIREEKETIKRLEKDIEDAESGILSQHRFKMAADYKNKIAKEEKDIQDIIEGKGKLGAVERFYEKDITNILEKRYGKENIEVITDEQGNSWREIKVNTARDLSPIMLQKDKEKILGMTNVKAGTILINAIEQGMDTVPHEYAHNYISWYRNTNQVKEGIKLMGSEEALVKAIGEQAAKQEGKAYGWWKRFTLWLTRQMPEKEIYVLTQAFLKNKKLISDYAGVGTMMYNEMKSGISKANGVSRDVGKELKAIDPSGIAMVAFAIGAGIPILKATYRATALGLTAISNAKNLKHERVKSKAEREELGDLLKNDWLTNKNKLLAKVEILEKERGSEVYGLSWLKELLESPAFVRTMEDKSPEGVFKRNSMWFGIVDFVQSYSKTMKPLKLKDSYMSKILINHTEPMFVASYFGNKTNVSDENDSFITMRDFLTGKPLVMKYGHVNKWLNAGPGGKIVVTSLAQQAAIEFNIRTEQIKAMGNLGSALLNRIQETGNGGKWTTDWNIIIDIMASKLLNNVKFNDNGDMIITDKDGVETEHPTAPWEKETNIIQKINALKIDNEKASDNLTIVLNKFMAENAEPLAKKYKTSPEKIGASMKMVLLLQQYNRWYLPRFLGGFKRMIEDIDSDSQKRYGEGIGQLELNKDIVNQVRQLENISSDPSALFQFVPILFSNEKNRDKFKAKMKDIMTKEYLLVSNLDPRNPEDLKEIDKRLGDITFHNYMWLKHTEDGKFYDVSSDLEIDGKVTKGIERKVELNPFQRRGLLKGIYKGKYGIDVIDIIKGKDANNARLSPEERDIMEKADRSSVLELKEDKTIKENNKFNIWGAHTAGYSYEIIGNLLPIKIKGYSEFFNGDYGITKGADIFGKWHKNFTESLKLRSANMLFKFYDDKMKTFNENPFARKAVLDIFRNEVGSDYGFYTQTKGTNLSKGDIVQIEGKGISMPFGTRRDIVIPSEDGSGDFVSGTMFQPNEVDWISGVVVGKDGNNLIVRDYLNDNVEYTIPADRKAYKVKAASELTAFADKLTNLMPWVSKTDINKRTNTSEILLKLPEYAIDLVSKLSVAGAIGGPVAMPKFASNNVISLDMYRSGGIKSVGHYLVNLPYFGSTIFTDKYNPVGSPVLKKAFISLGNTTNITFFQAMTELLKSEEGLKGAINKIKIDKERRTQIGEVSRGKAIVNIVPETFKQFLWLWHGGGLQQKQEMAIRKTIGAYGIADSYKTKDGELEIKSNPNPIDEMLDLITAATVIASAQSDYSSWGRPEAASTKFGRLWNMFLPYKSGKISSLFREFEQSSKVKLYSLIDENIKKGNKIVMPDLMNPGPNGEINLREYLNWNKALRRHAKEMVALGAMNMMKSYMKQGTSFFVANYILGNGTDKKLWENLTYYFGWTYNLLDSMAKIMGNSLTEVPQSAHELADAIYIQTYAGDKKSLAIQTDSKGIKSNMVIDKNIELIRKLAGGLGQGYVMEKGLIAGLQWFGTPLEKKYADRKQEDLKNHVMFKAPIFLKELAVEGKFPPVNLLQTINPLTHDKSDNDYLDQLQKRNPEQKRNHGAVIDWLFKEGTKKK